MDYIKRKYNINETKFLWYIITAIRGKEELIAEALKKKIDGFGFSELVEEIKIVKEKKVSHKFYTQEESPKKMVNSDNTKWDTVETNGVIKYRKTKTNEVNKFPGYIFIKMHIIDELWYIIRNTNGITGLVGSSGKNSKPIPISNTEINKLFNENETNDFHSDDESVYVPLKNNTNKNEFIECPFNLGDYVLIKSLNTYGEITKINNSKGTCTITTYELLGAPSDIENIYFDDLEIAKNENE